MGIPASRILTIYSAAGTTNLVIGRFPADANAIERGIYTVLVDGNPMD